jgi:hypothetical protein
MARRPGSCRALLWAFAAALVLKAAVPLLAAGAAHLQDVPVGSVCSIYGVTLPGAKGDPHAHHVGHHGHGSGDEAPSHSDTHREHCALSGLAAMAAWQAVSLATHPVSEAAPRSPGITTHCAADACAAWAARMQHPPPAPWPATALRG